MVGVFRSESRKCTVFCIIAVNTTVVPCGVDVIVGVFAKRDAHISSALCCCCCCCEWSFANNEGGMPRYICTRVEVKFITYCPVYSAR